MKMYPHLAHISTVLLSKVLLLPSLYIEPVYPVHVSRPSLRCAEQTPRFYQRLILVIVIVVFQNSYCFP